MLLRIKKKYALFAVIRSLWISLFPSVRLFFLYLFRICATLAHFKLTVTGRISILMAILLVFIVIFRSSFFSVFMLFSIGRCYFSTKTIQCMECFCICSLNFPKKNLYDGFRIFPLPVSCIRPKLIMQLLNFLWTRGLMEIVVNTKLKLVMVIFFRLHTIYTVACATDEKKKCQLNKFNIAIRIYQFLWQKKAKLSNSIWI